MISQPTRSNRLFSRRITLLFVGADGLKRPSAASEIRLREFLTLGHFMAYGEPANFELSVSNVIEESWEPAPGNYWSAAERPAS